MYVPCRKCDSCLNARSFEWSQRVERECTFHRYSMFCTLTYDNAHLPYFSECVDEDTGEIVLRSNRLCDSELRIPDELSYKFIHVTNLDKDCIPYVCRSDVKLFMKRFRSRIHYYFKKHNINEDERIRYFLCSEYGPVTLRPHYHAIVWFDSESICQHFEELFVESWPYGMCNFSLVNSSAPDYVAKYVNGSSRLPAVLQCKPCRTFHLQSKKPCIGYGSSDTEALFDNFLNGTYGHSELDPSSGTSVYVQPPRSLENRYFPKCREYYALSRFEKLRVYSSAYDFSERYREIGLSATRKEISSYLIRQFVSPVDIHSAWSCLKMCRRFHMTPERYLDLLDDYYSRKDLFLLGRQYEYQCSYASSGQPLHHCLDFDLTLFERFPRTDGLLSRFWFYLFKSYGIDRRWLYPDRYLDTFRLNSLHQCHSAFYQANVSLKHKMVDDSLKTKRLNERLQLVNYHKFRFH